MIIVESCFFMAATGVQKCTSVMFQHSPPLVQSLVLTTLALQDGWSPLHLASNKGYLNIVKTLIEAGANINQADKVQYFSTLHVHCTCML